MFYGVIYLVQVRTSYYVRLKSFVHVRAVVLIVALQIHEVLVGRLKESPVR